MLTGPERNIRVLKPVQFGKEAHISIIRFPYCTATTIWATIPYQPTYSSSGETRPVSFLRRTAVTMTNVYSDFIGGDVRFETTVGFGSGDGYINRTTLDSCNSLSIALFVRT